MPNTPENEPIPGGFEGREKEKAPAKNVDRVMREYAEAKNRYDERDKVRVLLKPDFEEAQLNGLMDKVKTETEQKQGFETIWKQWIQDFMDSDHVVKNKLMADLRSDGEVSNSTKKQLNSMTRSGYPLAEATLSAIAGAAKNILTSEKEIESLAPNMGLGLDRVKNLRDAANELVLANEKTKAEKERNWTEQKEQLLNLRLEAKDLDDLREAIVTKNETKIQEIRAKIAFKIEAVNAWMGAKTKKTNWLGKALKNEEVDTAAAEGKRQLLRLLIGVDTIKNDEFKTNEPFAYERDLRDYLAKGKEPEKLFASMEGRVKRFVESGKTLEDLGKEPAWQKINDTYERTVSTPGLKSAEFKIFQEGREHTQDAARAREYRQLFLVLMQESTDRFKNDFILGPEFTEDTKANRERFPYLHTLWLKENGAEDLQNRIESLEQEVIQAPNLGESTTALLKTMGQKEVPLPTPGDSLDALQKKQVAMQSILDRANTDFRNDSNYAAARPELERADQFLKNKVTLAGLEARMTLIDGQFTKENLRGKPEFMMRASLLRFKKAVETVDGVFAKIGGNLSENLHPAVRRILISLVYRHDGEGNYDSVIADLARDSGRLSLNRMEKTLGANETVLLAATIEEGLRQTDLFAAWDSKVQSKDKKAWEKLKKVYTETPDDFDNKLREFISLNEELYADIRETFDSRKEYFSLKELVKVPGSNNSIKKVKELNESAESRWREGKETSTRLSQALALDYDILNLHGRGVEGLLAETMGINLNGVYRAYVEYMKTHPELSSERWNDLLHSANPEDREAFVTMLQNILPEDKTGGKALLLYTLKGMGGDDPVMEQLLRKHISPNDAQVASLGILGIIKANIDLNAERGERTVAQGKEYASRLGGATLSDKLTGGIGKVWEMLTAPGRPIGERIAAAAVFYMAYEAGTKAFGDNPGLSGNLLKAGLLYFVADKVKKEFTGSGIMESFDVASISNAFQGTIEAAQVKSGKEIREEGAIKISEDQHYEALKQMNKVPFRKLMEWYRHVSADKEGRLLPKRGERDDFKKFKINTAAIAEHDKNESLDPQLVGREAVFKAMKSFFAYVGAKAGQNEVYGMNALEARWKRPIEGAHMEAAGKRYTEWMPPRELLNKYKSNPDALTWATVMESETEMKDVTATIGDNWQGKLGEWFKKAAEAAGEFTRERLVGPSVEGVREFIQNYRHEYGPAIKTLAEDAVRYGAAEVHLGKQYVTLVYRSNEPELLRFLQKHVELAKTGVGLPFRIAVPLYNEVFDFAVTGIKQVERILVEKYGKDLPPTPAGIIGNGNEFFRENTVSNPNIYAKGLGMAYNKQFKKAWNSENHYQEAQESQYQGDAKAVFDSITDDNLKKRIKGLESGVAYMAVEIGPAETTDLAPGLSPAMRAMEMHIKAVDKAKKLIIEKNPNEAYTDSDFNQYLVDITSVQKTSTEGAQPEKLYVFFRMPLRHSVEYQMKENKTWSDSYNQRNLKDRFPFLVDPNESLAANLIRAFGSHGTLNNVLSTLSAPARLTLAEMIRGANYLTVEASQKIAAVANQPAIAREGLNEAQKIYLDELLGSAAVGDGASGTFAMSDYYSSNETNRTAYHNGHRHQSLHIFSGSSDIPEPFTPAEANMQVMAPVTAPAATPTPQSTP